MAHTQWNSLMQGAIGQECRGEGCMPLRFTPAQMAVYADDPGYHACSQASSGMCLDCETDAEELILEATPSAALPGISGPLTYWWTADFLPTGRAALPRSPI